MNKKGFTLVEMIAAIAILAIITLIAIPSITRIRKDVLENTYNSRIDLIRYAALNWANDNLELVPPNVDTYDGRSVCKETINGEEGSYCALYNGDCITVETLIHKQYLNGTNKDKTEMEDPRDNTSLNGKRVCVRYDNNDVKRRKLIAYIVD